MFTYINVHKKDTSKKSYPIGHNFLSRLRNFQFRFLRLKCSALELVTLLKTPKAKNTNTRNHNGDDVDNNGKDGNQLVLHFI